jgi:hypothetical protein
VNATLLYHIASVLLLLFALGYRVGFLKLEPPTAECVALRAAMTNVHFQVSGRDYTYGGFYHGLGLYDSVFWFSPCWRLGTLTVIGSEGRWRSRAPA